MSEKRSHYYLWGIWCCWGASIIAFLFSHRLFMLISLSGMAGMTLLWISPYQYVKGMIIKMFNFNKKTGFKDIASADGLRTAAAASEPAKQERPVETHPTKETTISSGTFLRGEIKNENNLTISGEIEGDVSSKKVTHIGKEGKVIGKVTSLKVIVNGLLKGCCHAQSVIIMSQGRIEGDVYAKEFAIEKGGVFIGHSHQLEENTTTVDKTLKDLASDMTSALPLLASVAEDEIP